MRTDPGLELAKVGGLPTARVWLSSIDVEARIDEHARYNLGFVCDGDPSALLNYSSAWRQATQGKRQEFVVYVESGSEFFALRVQNWRLTLDQRNEEVTFIGSMYPSYVPSIRECRGEFTGVLDGHHGTELLVKAVDSAEPMIFHCRTGDE